VAGTANPRKYLDRDWKACLMEDDKRTMNGQVKLITPTGAANR